MNGHSNNSTASRPDLFTAAEAVAVRLESSAQVVLFSGAGLSTESGIPDYRGPTGTWTRDPDAQRALLDRTYAVDAELRRTTWQRRLRSPLWQAAPNRGHLAAARIQRAGMLGWIVTQNVDELHQIAGSDPDRLVELHGSMRRARCLSCGARMPMRDVLARVAAGDADPRCTAGVSYPASGTAASGTAVSGTAVSGTLAPNDRPGPAGGACGGVLQSDTVNFGEALDRALLAAAISAARSAEVLLVAGSSLSVHPAASLVPLAAEHGAWTVICNHQPTPYDGLASLVVRHSASELLEAVAERLCGSAAPGARTATAT